MLKNFRSVIPFLVIVPSVFFFSGCNFSKKDPYDMPMSASSKCSANPYLQKYNCSLEQVTPAAEAGDADAQYALGYMYYYGIGTPQDRETSMLWMQKAASQNQPLAQRALGILRSGGSLYDQGELGMPRSSGPSIRQPAEDVNHLNESRPEKPLTDVLPSYGTPSSPSNSSNSTSSSPDMGSPDISSSSSDQDSAISDDINNDNSVPMSNRPQSMMENKLLKMGKTEYGIQLMSGRDIQPIKRFIRDHRLKEINYYSANLNGKPWYALVYGSFQTIQKAQAEARRLASHYPEIHPWVKSYRIVQEEIRKNEVIG